MKKHAFKFTIALLLVLLLPVAIASADNVGDRVIHAGERFEGDINISDDLIVEAGAVVAGNVHVLNNDATVAGTIDGNLLVVRGDLELTEGAVVTGDCVVVGGDIDRNDPNVDCYAVGGNGLGVANSIPVNMVRGEVIGGDGRGSSWGALFSGLFYAVMALVVAAAVPARLGRVEDAIAIKPVASGVLGALTFAATTSLMVLITLISIPLLLVCVGVLGFPIVLAMGALLAGGLLLGYVAVGNIVGQVIARSFKLHQLSLPLQAALGTGLLSLALGLARVLPLGGFSASLATLIIAAIGLGGVTLTRFGARHYPSYLVQDAAKPAEPLKVMVD